MLRDKSCSSSKTKTSPSSSLEQLPSSSNAYYCFLNRESFFLVASDTDLRRGPRSLLVLSDGSDYLILLGLLSSVLMFSILINGFFPLLSLRYPLLFKDSILDDSLDEEASSILYIFLEALLLLCI